MAFSSFPWCWSVWGGEEGGYRTLPIASGLWLWDGLEKVFSPLVCVAAASLLLLLLLSVGVSSNQERSLSPSFPIVKGRAATNELNEIGYGIHQGNTLFIFDPHLTAF